jgi:predicted phosphodiesterase
MKIKLVSDLHLEFSDIVIPNDDKSDLLILAGDIMTACDLYEHKNISSKNVSIDVMKKMGTRQCASIRFRDFLDRVSASFENVIYVAGNHEFYNFRWVSTIDVLRDECSKFPNIHFLENDVKIIDDIVFIGGTLWTNMNKNDPLTLEIAKGMLNDFRVIKDEERGFSRIKPLHTSLRHKHTLNFFQETVEKDPTKNYVVVGHHSPSFLSCHPKYGNDRFMNSCYHSDLSDFILDHPQIKLWCHGHTHHAFDYLLGDTRIVCNPRGYESEQYVENSMWDITKTIIL